MEINKRTAEYWDRRFEQILIDSERLGLDYEKRLAKIYEEVKLQTQKELDSFYVKYAKDNKISLAEARKRLNGKELKTFKTQQQIYLDKVNELIAKGVPLENYAKTLKKLSGRAYVSRLQEIQNNLNSIITIATGEQDIMLGNTLNSTYLQGYFQTVFTLQQGLGFGMSFNVPDTQAVAKILKTPWDGSNYSNAIWSNKDKLTTWLNKDLPRHFASGAGVKEMSKDLQKQLGTNYNNAVRLVRTEVNYISNQSSMDGYKESGVVEKYQILATLDNRTSEVCRDMDGKVFTLAQEQVGVTFPPFHPRCRTTTVPFFDDEDLSELTRIARDENGKNYYVPANMTYREWQKKYAK